MANEVIIEEYGSQIYSSDGYKSGSAMPEPITSQIKSIAALSDAFDPKTSYVIVKSKGTGFWIKPGDSAASAAANTAGNFWVAADGSFEFPVTKNGVKTFTNVDTAADA